MQNTRCTKKQEKKTERKKLNTQVDTIRAKVFNKLTLFLPHILLDSLRQNATGKRAISVFNGQKPCTRITLSILQSFLHFLKAKDINSCLKQHQKHFLMATRESKFQSSEKLFGKT